MSTTSLSRWGTGQGVHVSKKAMEEARVKVGDSCIVTARPGVITLDFNRGEHRVVRCEPVTFDDVFGTWHGVREDAGSELDDLPPVGKEAELWGD